MFIPVSIRHSHSTNPHPFDEVRGRRGASPLRISMFPEVEMSLSNMRIGRKLTLSFATLVLVLVALSGIVIKSLGDMDFASFWNAHTYQVPERANEMMSAMVNQETGLRGFLVSGDETFLDPYKGGRSSSRARLILSNN